MKTLLIKEGHIIDPQNKIDCVANIFIKDGKVACVSDEFIEADQVINCEGKIVCPGFIDIHMHEDPYDPIEDKLDKSIALSMVKMGVTTAIGGNCGDNVFDPQKYLEVIDRKGTAINIGLFAGHTYIRNKCGGQNKYASVNNETLNNMVYLCKKYLDNGCFGVSYGLKYIPGTTGMELTEMTKLCKPGDKLITAHVRYDCSRVIEAVKEVADLGKSLGVRVQISHIGSMGGYGQMTQVLKTIDEYKNDGLDILCDCYPYNAFSTYIGETTYDNGFLEAYNSDYDSVLICDGKYAGMRCTKEIFEELRATAPNTLTVGFFMKEEEVLEALLNPNVIIGSDGVRNGDAGHPRAAGTFPRFISRFAKAGKISLYDAIDKMTNKTAKRLRLTNKGNLSVGSDADIVIFDYNKINDKATYENPAEGPEGIEYVIIDGQIAVENGKILKDNLGKAVRCI
jgi:N-acyl-D-amino-acid deacylase